MSKTHRLHRSFYVPHPLDDALRNHPEVNISQVCRTALEAATGLIASQEDSGTLSTKLASIEASLRSSNSTHEKIARLAAQQAGMVVLTPEEVTIYREILSGGINQFVFRTRKEAVEEYHREQEKARTALKANKAKKNKAAAPQTTLVANKHEETQVVEPEQQEVARCIDCGDNPDIACKQCNRPLCWVCWAGSNLDGKADELCQDCRLDQDISSGRLDIELPEE